MGVFGGSGGVGGDDVEIRVTADTSDAEKKFRDLNAMTHETGTKQVALGTLIGNVTGKALGAFITNAVGLFGEYQVKLAHAGEELSSLEAGFLSLGGSLDSLDDAKERTLGVVSSVDLLTAANKAMVAGLPDINQNFADIADLGGRLSGALGIDATQGVNNLSQAIAKGETAQLRQYGIFVDSHKAIREYASANGLLAKTMTENQKKAAIQAASLEQVRDRLRELPEAGDSVSNALNAIGNTYDDLYAQAGQFINQNAELNSSLREFDNNLQNIDPSIFGQLVSDVFTLGIDIANNLLPSANAFGQVLLGLSELAKQWGSIFSNVFKAIIQGFSGLSGAATEALVGIIPGGKKAAEALGVTFSGTEELREAFDALATIEVPSWEKALEAAATKNFNFKKSMDEATKAAEEQGRKLKTGLINPLDETARTLDKTAKKTVEFVNINKWFADQMTQEALTDKIEELNEAFKDGALDVLGYKDQLIALQTEFKNASGSAEAWNSAMSKVDIEAPEIKGDAKVSDDLFGLGDTMSQAMGNVVSGMIDQLKSKLNEALGLESGGIGESIGAAIGSAAGAALATAFGVDPQVGAMVGNFLGSTLGALADKAFGGSSNLETKARRNVEKFVDEIFKTWDFMARDASGRMVRFEDLVLGDRRDFNEGTEFNQWLNSIDQSLRQTFVAFGGALGMEFADDFVAGAQIGEKLLHAWAGDIDSLQLLLLEAGMDFEKFGENMERAFKKGQISAVEFQVFMAQGEEMFQPGLVGFARYEDAMSNFIDSQGRGERALKSFRDMFIEWREANPTGTLEEFRQQLIASGKYAVEDVDAFFNQIYASGIHSIEELIQVSDRFIIDFIANLDRAGFAFAKPLEDVQQKLDTLENSLATLPEAKVVNVDLRVRSTFDSSETKNAWNQEFGGGIGMPREG